MPLRPAARLLARFTQAREFFTQLDLQPAVDRPVVGPLAHRVGETGLVQRDAAFGLVVILVTLRVAELFHQLGRGIAQVQRYLLGAVLDHVAPRCLVRDVRGVGLGRGGQVDRQLREGEFAYGAAESIEGVLDRLGHLVPRQLLGDPFADVGRRMPRPARLRELRRGIDRRHA